MKRMYVWCVCVRFVVGVIGVRVISVHASVMCVLVRVVCVRVMCG